MEQLIYGIMSQDLETNPKIAQALNIAEKHVYLSICAYYLKKGKTVFSTKQILETSFLKKKMTKPSDNSLIKLNEIITKLSAMQITFKSIFTNKSIYEGYLIAISRVYDEIKIHSKMFNTEEQQANEPYNYVWRLLDTPFLITLNKVDLFEILGMSAEPQFKPKPNSQLTLDIRTYEHAYIHMQLTSYLIEIVNGNIPNKIVLKKFLEKQCDIEPKFYSIKQNEQFKKCFELTLDIAKENNVIGDYKKTRLETDKRHLVYYISKPKKLKAYA